MRKILSGYFYRVIVVVGILGLAGLVSADIWLWQRDDGSSAPEPGQGANDRFEAPGLPARNTNGKGDGGSSSGASASDSVELEIRRGDSSEVETIQIEGASGTGSEPTAGSEATAGGPTEPEVKQEQTPAPSGGPGDVAVFEDSAEIVVRDSEGNIKKQEKVK